MMLITVSQEQGKVPVTVLHLHGDLDSSNYTEVIKKTREVHSSGARNVIIDMSDVPYMSSAGLMCMQMVAMLFSGHSQGRDEAGGPVVRAFDPRLDEPARRHVKLVNPGTQVQGLLETVGLKQFFAIFSDVQSAVDSF